MKKVLYSLFALTAVLASCQREELEVIKPSAPSAHVYRFELSEGETRATLEEDGVFWEAGDQVGLYPGSATSVAANVNAETTPKTVTFTSGTPLEAGTQIYAYYPFQTGNTDATATKIVFPAAQNGGSVSAMPMAGVPFQVRSGDTGTDGVIRFLNLGAVIDFRVYSAKFAGERVETVKFEATSGTNPVSGEATIDLTGVIAGEESTLGVTWAATATNPSSVTLTQYATVPETKDAAVDGHLYMVVAPGTYSGTITIKTNAASYSFPFSNRTLTRNTITRYNMKLDGTSATREAWYVKVNTADEIVDGGKYLIVYESGSSAKVFHPILNSDGNTYATHDNVTTADIQAKGIKVNASVEACEVVLEKSSGTAFNIKVPSAGNKYLYLSSSSIKVGAKTTTFTCNNGTVTLKRSDYNYYLRYSKTDSVFDIATSTSSTSSSTTTLALYRPDEGGVKRQNLQFSEVYPTFSLDGQTVPVTFTGAPALSGAMTPVTYTSSNTSVATVNASTGTVTVVGLGQTVITAVAADTEQYLGASASYTLTVWEIPTYSVENDRVAAYLDYVEAHPYGPNYPSDYTVSWITTYSSGTGQNNRLDWPKPVPISWETSISGTPTVLVYNDEAHTSQELTANVTKTSSTSADIYSLIPGRTYWYVVKNGNTEVASGRFATTGRRRMIKVGESQYGKPYANNCRDFGGLTTVDGKTVRFGKIYRGSNMNHISNNQKTYLLQYMGVGLDVDLRQKRNIDDNDGTYQKDALGLDTMHTTEEYYNWETLTAPGSMSSTLSKIFDAVVNKQVGVYIHCMVGADRTGYVCMLLEAILGVRQDLCDTDYEMTSFSGAVGTRRRDDTSKSYYYYPLGIEMLSLEQGSTLQEKAINYVTSLPGITPADVQAFQDAMLED